MRAEDSLLPARKMPRGRKTCRESACSRHSPIRNRFDSTEGVLTLRRKSGAPLATSAYEYILAALAPSSFTKPVSSRSFALFGLVHSLHGKKDTLFFDFLQATAGGHMSPRCPHDVNTGLEIRSLCFPKSARIMSELTPPATVKYDQS